MKKEREREREQTIRQTVRESSSDCRSGEDEPWGSAGKRLCLSCLELRELSSYRTERAVSALNHGRISELERKSSQRRRPSGRSKSQSGSLTCLIGQVCPVPSSAKDPPLLTRNSGGRVSRAATGAGLTLIREDGLIARLACQRRGIGHALLGYRRLDRAGGGRISGRAGIRYHAGTTDSSTCHGPGNLGRYADV